MYLRQDVFIFLISDFTFSQSFEFSKVPRGITIIRKIAIKEVKQKRAKLKYEKLSKILACKRNAIETVAFQITQIHREK